MIKPEELRTGNFLSFDGGTDKINAQFIAIIESGWYQELHEASPDKFPIPEPIRVTKRWLQYFGFKKNSGLWFIKEIDNFKSMLINYAPIDIKTEIKTKSLILRE